MVPLLAGWNLHLQAIIESTPRRGGGVGGGLRYKVFN